jgi:hypothetical protein
MAPTAVALALLAGGCAGAPVPKPSTHGAGESRGASQSSDSHRSRVVGYGSVWKLNADAGTVTRLDRRTGAVQARIHLRLPRPIVAGRRAPEDWAFGPLYVALGHGAAWVATDRGWVAEIGVASNRVIRTVRTPPEGTDGITVGRRYVWIVAALGGLVRIDPQTARRVQVPICWRRCGTRGQRLNVTDVMASRKRVWVAGSGWHGPQYGTWRRTPRMPWPGMPRRRIPVELPARGSGTIRLPLRS